MIRYSDLSPVVYAMKEILEDQFVFYVPACAPSPTSCTGFLFLQHACMHTVTSLIFVCLCSDDPGLGAICDGWCTDRCRCGIHDHCHWSPIIKTATGGCGNALQCRFTHMHRHTYVHAPMCTHFLSLSPSPIILLHSLSLSLSLFLPFFLPPSFFFPSLTLSPLYITHSQSRALPRIVGLCRAADPRARYIWLGILLAYKGIFLIVGLFLAFETRKVKIRHLNDSKLIGMSVYGIVVLSVALAAIGIFLEAMVSVFYIVTGLMILVGNTCLLCLIFLPKVGLHTHTCMAYNVM